MTCSPTLCRCLVLFLVAFLAPRPARAEGAEWKKEKAAAYLDQRETTWFAFLSAGRGEGATQSTCVSCHTVLPYALARPVLRARMGVKAPTKFEKQLLAQTKKRVEGWSELDSAKFGLLYDFNAQKKKESWGTEAVLNAVILAFDDHHQARKSPSDGTKRALANLWKVQVRQGGQQGSWDWLDFNLEPWEAKGSRYFGAALAAVAVGTAPGYDKEEATSRASIDRLRRYLKGEVAGQSLYNRSWALWASAKLDGVLTEEEQKKVVGELFEKQCEDGGWSLSSLGPFVRRDGSVQETASDGYATGLVLHALQTAGVTKDNTKVARGLAWLRKNQTATGAWRGVSVNKKRNPTTHVGMFMSDAATAFALLALSH